MTEQEKLENPNTEENFEELGDDPLVDDTLPEIDKWVSHEKSHGSVSYTSSQGHICNTINCEINQNPHKLWIEARLTK
jgi:hypothetical protein